MEKLSSSKSTHHKQSWKDEFLDSSIQNGTSNIFADEFLEREGHVLSREENFTEFDEFENDQMVDDFNKFESPSVQDFQSFESSNLINDFLSTDQRPEDDWVDGFLDDSSGYLFTKNNPFLGDPEAFEKGLEFFNDGMLSDAILAFESAVQNDRTDGKSWHYLGIAQAESDRDDLAISALETALSINPEDKDTLISLAVSYINEFNTFKPLECLANWIKLTPRYASIVNDMDDLVEDDFDHNHEVVTDSFLRAARMSPHDPDPDIQIGLALLFNLNRDIPKSIDCLKAALQKRPNDYLLWNRLGACQANNGRCEEAIESYFNALTIKPSFTRARANLGISFKTLKEYDDATKCFVGALATNPNAKRIWSNLIKTFESMGRKDLVERCYKKDATLFDEFNF